MISAQVTLTQPLRDGRQFVGQSGSGHHLVLDDAAGATGPKPIELGLIGFDPYLVTSDSLVILLVVDSHCREHLGWLVSYVLPSPMVARNAWGSKSSCFFLAARFKPTALRSLCRFGSIRVWRATFLLAGEPSCW